MDARGTKLVLIELFCAAILALAAILLVVTLLPAIRGLRQTAFREE